MGPFAGLLDQMNLPSAVQAINDAVNRGRSRPERDAIAGNKPDRKVFSLLVWLNILRICGVCVGQGRIGNRLKFFGVNRLLLLFLFRDGGYTRDTDIFPTGPLPISRTTA